MPIRHRHLKTSEQALDQPTYKLAESLIGMHSKAMP